MQYLVQLILCLHLLMPVAVTAQTVATVQKDPLTYTLAQYGLILALSLLGGVVSWYGKVKRQEVAPTSIMNLVGELTTSALAGLLTFYVCEWLNFDRVLSAAIVGLAGHMGARGIAMAEEAAQRYFEKKAAQ